MELLVHSLVDLKFKTWIREKWFRSRHWNIVKRKRKAWYKLNPFSNVWLWCLWQRFWHDNQIKTKQKKRWHKMGCFNDQDWKVCGWWGGGVEWGGWNQLPISSSLGLDQLNFSGLGFDSIWCSHYESLG